MPLRGATPPRYALGTVMTAPAPWLRALCLAAAALGCSRPTPAPSAAAPSNTAAPASPFGTEPALQLRHGTPGERMARAARNVSQHANTDEGLRAFAADLVGALQGTDSAAQERLRREFTPDPTRFELALTFDAARTVRERLVPEVDARRDALLARLGALHGPVTVTVHAAEAQSLNAASGLDARLVAVRGSFHPQVRLHRAVVRGTDGTEVTLEPMAFLGGQWTWLAEVWTVLTPAPTVPPTGPATVTAR